MPSGDSRSITTLELVTWSVSLHHRQQVFRSLPYCKLCVLLNPDRRTRQGDCI